MQEWWPIFTLGLVVGGVLGIGACTLLVICALSLEAFVRNYGEAGGPPNERSLIVAHEPWPEDTDDKV